MPSILNDEDKDTVKRFVPKQNNKIQAVAVARLYIALPGRPRWTYTGLQGAVVLANDLVGNTYWLKMVDISVSHLASTRIPRERSPKLTKPSSHLAEVSSGIRRSLIVGATTKTERSFIHSSWRNA